MPGLDMSHGFVDYIRNNQIKRSEFDTKLSTDVKARRQSRPSLQMYQPPGRNHAHGAKNIARRTGCKAAHVSHPISREYGTSMVQLRFIDHAENLHHFVIRKNDEPGEIAKDVCTQLGYGEVYIEPLAKEIVAKCKEHFSN